jgi:hypothetical protein
MTGAHTLYTDPDNTLGQVEDLLGDTVNRVRQLPTRQDLDRVSNKSARNRTIAICVALSLGIVSVIISVLTAYNQGQTAAAAAINASSIQALQQARDELRRSGVPEESLPAVPLPNQPMINTDALVDATTALVLAKIRTDPKFRGETGADGMPCDPTVYPECIGPKGDPGPAGPPPTCESTPEGCVGRDGTNGADGSDAPVPSNARFTLATADDPMTCVYRVDYVKPGTDEVVKTLDADVPDQFCA